MRPVPAPSRTGSWQQQGRGRKRRSGLSLCRNGEAVPSKFKEKQEQCESGGGTIREENTQNIAFRTARGEEPSSSSPTGGDTFFNELGMNY